MKYIKERQKYDQINEDNEIAFVVKKFIDDYINDILKYKFSVRYYEESKLLKRGDNDMMNDISTKFASGSSGSSSMNNHEKEDKSILYRYETVIKKSFKVNDKNPFVKQRKIYEKQLEMAKNMKNLEQKLSNFSTHSKITIYDNTKNSISFSIIVNFSSQGINKNALKKINTVK